MNGNTATNCFLRRSCASTLGETMARLHATEDVFFAPKFLAARPLLRALQEPRGADLLIDEIDKSDQGSRRFFSTYFPTFHDRCWSRNWFSVSAPGSSVSASQRIRLATTLGSKLKIACERLELRSATETKRVVIPACVVRVRPRGVTLRCDNSALFVLQPSPRSRTVECGAYLSWATRQPPRYAHATFDPSSRRSSPIAFPSCPFAPKIALSRCSSHSSRWLGVRARSNHERLTGTQVLTNTWKL